MRWGRDPSTEKEFQQWHPWFAWRPIKFTGTRQRAWLETVARQVLIPGSERNGLIYRTMQRHYRPWEEVVRAKMERSI